MVLSNLHLHPNQTFHNSTNIRIEMEWQYSIFSEIWSNYLITCSIALSVWASFLFFCTRERPQLQQYFHCHVIIYKRQKYKFERKWMLYRIDTYVNIYTDIFTQTLQVVRYIDLKMQKKILVKFFLKNKLWLQTGRRLKRKENTKSLDSTIAQQRSLNLFSM